MEDEIGFFKATGLRALCVAPAKMLCNMHDRTRWRPVTHKPHIEIELQHQLKRSPHGGVNPIVLIAECTSAKLSEQNHI